MGRLLHVRTTLFASVYTHTSDLSVFAGWTATHHHLHKASVRDPTFFVASLAWRAQRVQWPTLLFFFLAKRSTQEMVENHTEVRARRGDGVEHLHGRRHGGCTLASRLLDTGSGKEIILSSSCMLSLYLSKLRIMSPSIRSTTRISSQQLLLSMKKFELTKHHIT